MENEQTQSLETKNPFPFNNLFLIKGYTTGKNDFWMYMIGIIAIIIGYAFIQNIVFSSLSKVAIENGVSFSEISKNQNIVFNAKTIGFNKSIMLALLGGMFAFSLFMLWLNLKYVHKKSFKSIITSYDKIRWKRYFFAFLIWSILSILYVLSSYLINPQNFTYNFQLSKFLTLLIVAIVFIPIQTITEELIIRSYLLQGLSLVFKNGIVPLIITSILFGLLHGDNPEVKAHGYIVMMPYYILFGAFLCVLTLLDEGAELAMGIHCANNLVSALLVCSKTSVLQTDSIFITLTDYPIIEFISWIVMALICFFILFKKYKLTNWKLIIR